jgi:hypothetical protein
LALPSKRSYSSGSEDLTVPVRLRCVSQRDAQILLDRLGIVLPKRMRLAEYELPTRVLSAWIYRKNVVATFSLRH